MRAFASFKHPNAILFFLLLLSNNATNGLEPLCKAIKEMAIFDYIIKWGYDDRERACKIDSDAVQR